MFDYIVSFICGINREYQKYKNIYFIDDDTFDMLERTAQLFSQLN